MARGQGRKRKSKAESSDQQAPAAEAANVKAADAGAVAAEEPSTPAEESAPAASEPAKAPEAPKRSPQKLDRADPDDQEMTLDEAAGAMVDGFKESWLPAIRAKARSMGAGETASRRVWRGIFIAWGGPSILR